MRTWIFAVAIIVAVALLATIGILFGRSAPAGYYYYPPFFFFFGWWWVFPLFFFGFFFLLRWWWGWGFWWGSRIHYDPALEMLRERYARGELTKEQYEQMARDLQQAQ